MDYSFKVGSQDGLLEKETFGKSPKRSEGVRCMDNREGEAMAEH